MAVVIALAAAGSALRSHAALVLSEVLCDNASSLVDWRGEHSDWIEIYNPGPENENLAGWYLTDDPADLTKWPNSPLVFKLIGKPMSDAKAAWQNASPVNHVVSNSPPVFLYHGEWDKLVEIEQMKLMAAELAAKGVPVESHTVKFLGHVATYVLAGGAEQQGIKFTKKQLAR